MEIWNPVEDSPGLILIMVALNGKELPPERRIASETVLPVFKSHIK